MDESPNPSKKTKFIPNMEESNQKKAGEEESQTHTHDSILKDPVSNPHVTLPSAAEGELEKAATNAKSCSPAKELGLSDKEFKMIIFQLPPVLPVVEQAVSHKGKEKIGTSEASDKGSKLHELSGGCIGKMQVYKSGAVKLKIGENQFNVVANPKTNRDQEVVAMNKKKKDFSVLDAVIVNTKAVLIPHFDGITPSKE